MLLVSFVAKSHPFYVSICEIEHNSENESLEISLKVFANDFEEGLKKSGTGQLFLGETREVLNADSLIFSYLQTHLKFKVNQADVNYAFVGKEMEDNVVWIYLEIVGVKELSTFQVSNRILMDSIKEQQNIIQINCEGKIKNLMLNAKKYSGSLSF